MYIHIEFINIIIILPLFLFKCCLNVELSNNIIYTDKYMFYSSNDVLIIVLLFIIILSLLFCNFKKNANLLNTPIQIF